MKKREKKIFKWREERKIEILYLKSYSERAKKEKEIERE